MKDPVGKRDYKFSDLPLEIFPHIFEYVPLVDSKNRNKQSTTCSSLLMSSHLFKSMIEEEWNERETKQINPIQRNQFIINCKNRYFKIMDNTMFIFAHRLKWIKVIRGLDLILCLIGFFNFVIGVRLLCLVSLIQSLYFSWLSIVKYWKYEMRIGGDEYHVIMAHIQSMISRLAGFYYLVGWIDFNRGSSQKIQQPIESYLLLVSNLIMFITYLISSMNFSPRKAERTFSLFLPSLIYLYFTCSPYSINFIWSFISFILPLMNEYSGDDWGFLSLVLIYLCSVTKIKFLEQVIVGTQLIIKLSKFYWEKKMSELLALDVYLGKHKTNRQWAMISHLIPPKGL